MPTTATASKRDASSNIVSIHSPTMRWIDITAPKKRQLLRLQQEFHFHPLDTEDCLEPNQYPKIDSYPHYLFMILHFPSYESRQREIRAQEVHFFIFPQTLITVHDEPFRGITQLATSCQKDPSIQQRLIHGNPSALLYEILYTLLTDIYPILNNSSANLKAIEQSIFSGYEKRMVKEILLAKRNIVNFRNMTQSHKTVIEKLIQKSERLFSTAQLKIYYENLVEHTKDIWTILENQKETIEALQETNESLISFRLNDIMKLLTGMSVVMLPVTLIASIMGINAPIPWIANNPNGFWMVMGIMIFTATTLILYFKHRDWL